MQITLDEGYQFGLGIFETIRIEQNHPILLTYHLERLRRSLKALDIAQTVGRDEIVSYLSGRHLEHHALKVIVSEKNIVFTERPNPYTKAQYEKGFSLSYSQVLRNETSPLVFHKTLNYGDCILEKRRAARQGYDEMIFCNSRKELCEGTATNLFFVRGNTIYTPPISCGLLPGTTRRFLLEHFPVTERALHREDISRMDECFVTNALLGIMPVTSLGEHRFPGREMTQKCMDSYFKTFNLK